MNIIKTLKHNIKEAASKCGFNLSEDEIVIEMSKDNQHGDYATSVAMQLAKAARSNPRQIAASLCDSLDKTICEKIEIAGPGFINFFLKEGVLASIIETIISENDAYGASDHGNGTMVNVEFVSANPTGALHLGHARGAALGDVIARLLKKVGYGVTKEFYVNDAGAQIDNLAKSIHVRYQELFGRTAALPEDGYHGHDIIDIATEIKDAYGDKYLDDLDLPFFKAEGIRRQLERIRADLDFFRVNFDVFSYETDVRNAGAMHEVRQKLTPYLYELDGALFLKTTAFGDDKDRVVVKSDGKYTYFWPDIVYHLDKLRRNHRFLIDILGADHHGYISRMVAALAMLGYPTDTLDVEILQLVRLIKDGQEMRMSKRTGVGVTLRELCTDVGVDAARYFFVARASSSHLDFDIDLANSASNANPVYYAQYAHARLCSLLSAGANLGIDVSGTGLVTPEEKQLLRHLGQFRDEVLDAALTKSPYKITNYVQKLATYTHSFYTICRVIDKENISLSQARLALVKASRITMANALDLLGVTAPFKM